MGQTKENQDADYEASLLINLVNGVVKHYGLAVANMMEAMSDLNVKPSTQGVISGAVNAAAVGRWDAAVGLANDIADVESIACAQFAENMRKAKIFHYEVHVWLDDERKQKKKDIQFVKDALSGPKRSGLLSDASERILDSIPCKEDGMVYADTSFGPVQIPVGYNLHRKPSSPMKDFYVAVHIEDGWRSEARQNPRECAFTANARARVFAEASSAGTPELLDGWKWYGGLSDGDGGPMSAVRSDPYCRATVSPGSKPGLSNLTIDAGPKEPVPKLPIAVADALLAKWRSR